jgi:hypothetical protein
MYFLSVRHFAVMFNMAMYKKLPREAIRQLILPRGFFICSVLPPHPPELVFIDNFVCCKNKFR